jgi:hypothetical protein
MTDLVRINDEVLSWNSCLFKFNGIPFTGITSFNYKEKRERALVHGARRDGQPLGMTVGKYSVEEMTLTMLRDSANRLTDLLTPLGLGSYGDASFVMIVQYAEPAQPQNLVTVIAQGCRVVSASDANQEGVEALVTEFGIQCMNITKNGKRLWSVVRNP